VTTGTAALGFAAAGATAIMAVILGARRGAGTHEDLLLDEREHRQAEARARYFNDVGDSAGF
jgi:hypothetical protein